MILNMEGGEVPTHDDASDQEEGKESIDDNGILKVDAMPTVTTRMPVLFTFDLDNRLQFMKLTRQKSLNH
jgi:hypothetical protein